MRDPVRRASDERIARDGATWRNLTVAQAAWSLAQTSADTPAFYLESGTVSYGELASQARRLIAGLQALGLQTGDRIAFQLPNWIEVAVIDIAASALGLTVVPIVPIYRDRELAFILADAQVRAVFIPQAYRSTDFLQMYQRLAADLPALNTLIVVRGDEDFASESLVCSFEQLLVDTGKVLHLEDVDPNSVKAILYTSGTTGSPKAVMHSHNTLTRVIDNMVERLTLTDADRMLMASPVTHITGYANGIMMPFVTATTTALMERWDAAAAVEFINATQATLSVGATPFLKELLDASERLNSRLPSMRFFVCGGAAVPPQLIYRAGQVLEKCRAFRVYGSTEVPIVTIGWPGDDERQLAAETDGQVFNYDVRILDDEGCVVPQAGTAGEIATRGPGMMLGYQDDDQDAFTYSDGFFLTGDIGFVTEGNAIVITDRKKDIIIRGGENISAKEVEDVLHGHPLIREAAVVSMPHERLGEGVFAYLLLDNETDLLTLADVASFAEQAKLARQKIPEAIEVLSDFPRTPSGKVRKDRLRARLLK